MQEHSTKFWSGLARRVATMGLAGAMAFSAVSTALPTPAAAATGTNVTGYGVKTDGTDSTSALQTLVNGGGKSLYFPAGTYRFAGISVPANTTLTFETGAKILPGASGNFMNVNGANVTINGGSFDGQNVKAIAIMGNGVSGLKVNGTSATNMTNSNVNLVNCTNAEIRNTKSTYCQYGIVLSHSSYSTIDGNYTYSMGRDGVLCYSSTHHVTVSNNTIDTFTTLKQTGRAGLHFYGSSDFIVFGNTVKNGLLDSEGIRFRDAERFQCFNNTVDNMMGSGIAVVYIGDWVNVNGIVGGDGAIYNNKITNSHLRGISVPYTVFKPVKIMDNIITNVSSNFEPIDPADGIICYAKDSQIVGNVITNSTGNGIRTGNTNILVADNTINNVGTGTLGQLSGILAQNGGATIVRNTVNGAKHYGVLALSSAYLEGNSITSAAYGATKVASTTGKYLADATAPSAWDDIKTSYNGGETFNLSASDANSGLAAVRVTIDGGPVHSYPASPVNMSVGTAGTHTISYWAVDKAGNLSAVQKRTYSVGSIVVPTPTPEPTPTPDPTPAPVIVNAPTNLAGTAADSSGSTIATINWRDNATNEAGYSIERAYVHDGVTDAWVTMGTVAANTTTYQNRFTAGLTYKYRVRATATSGTSTVYSAYSNDALVASPSAPAPTTPPTATVPSAPTSLTATLAFRSQAKLRWADTSKDETAFRIWIADPSGVWSIYADVDPDTTSFATPRLTAGTWQFKVCAINDAGESALSNVASITVK